MVWDPTVPATNAALASAPIRDNFQALNTTLYAGGTDGQVLTRVTGSPTWANPAGGTTLVGLSLDAARFPDGTAGNAFPQPIERISSGTPASGVPKLVELVYQFDATTAEFLIFKGLVPVSYTGGTVTLVTKWSMLTATTGNVRVMGALGCAVDGTTLAGALVTTAAITVDVAVPATLGQQKETRLTLTGLSGVAASRKFVVVVSLQTAAASNATGDRVLEACGVEFA